jgi:hypothetical protein
MKTGEQEFNLDLLDFAFITAGAAYPPLLLVTIGQWFIRRSWTFNVWAERALLNVVQERAPNLLSESIRARVFPTTMADRFGNDDHTVLSDSSTELALPHHHLPDTNQMIHHLGGRYHLLIIGHTRGGKTATLHAIARYRAAQRATVIVCDPDAIDGKYPGYTCVGAGDNFSAIKIAIEDMQATIATRRQQRKNGKRSFDEYWFMVDEAHEIKSEIDGAWDILEDAIRRGGKLNIHVCIATQDGQVATLGLQGKSKLLINLTQIEVYQRTDGVRCARFGKSDEIVMPLLPSPDDTVSLRPKPTEDNALLTSLLMTVSGSPERKTTETSKPVSVVLNRFEKPAETDIQTTIRRMYDQGISKNKIWQDYLIPHGIRNKVKALETIDHAIADEAPQD